MEKMWTIISVFLKKSLIIIVLYVGDFFIVSYLKEERAINIELMISVFKIKDLGAVSSSLGMKDGEKDKIGYAWIR